MYTLYLTLRSQTPCIGDRSGLAALSGSVGGPSVPAASPHSAATTPLCRRARELADIDPKYVSQVSRLLLGDGFFGGGGGGGGTMDAGGV